MKELSRLSPDIVAFSCTADDYEWVCSIARVIKENLSDIPIVVGGAHPTFCPEIIEQNSDIDIICRGEGEYAFLELIDKISNGDNIKSIGNLWIRDRGVIHKNEVRPLIGSLEDLPFPDRGVYYKYKLLRDNPIRFFMASRGCPFSCSFCFNDKMQSLYSNKGNYTRFRSAGSLIEEIKAVRREYGMKFVRFEDDIFILNKKWLFEFLERYTKDIKVPFLCYIRADILEEETVKRLKEGGCYSVLFGIETGNEEKRMSLLRKTVTNEQIVKAASLLKKYNIKFFTSNMLALPGETLREAFETININSRIKADDVWCSVFQPLPNLALTEYALGKDLITREDIKNSRFNTFLDNKLRQKDIGQIFSLHKFFYISVNFPYLMPVIKRLIRLPLNPIFNSLFLMCYALSYYKHSKVSAKRVLREGLCWFAFFTRA